MRKLTPIEWNNQRIMTTKLVAECYETEERRITENFNRNKERFIEGKHYYKLTGEELKQFKNLVAESVSVSSKTSVLYLWTDKGMLRHAKILDNDKAWEVYEMLEDTYFKVQDINQDIKQGIKDQYEQLKLEFTAFELASHILNLNESSKLIGVTNIYKEYGISTTALPAYTDSRGILKSATELLKENNISISAIKFNKIMIDKGYLIEVERTSGKDKSKIKKFKNLVKTEFGENQISPKNPKETQPMYYENKFLELLKELGIK